jgi:HEAT repeat protein
MAPNALLRGGLPICAALAMLGAGCMPPPPLEPDPPVADAALRARSIQVIRSMLDDRRSSGLRAHAVEAYRMALGKTAMSTLERATADRSARVRGTALMAIGDLAAPIGKTLGRRLLADKDPLVQLSAVYAMSRAGDRSAQNLLAVALADSGRPHVQAQAAMILGKLGDRSAVPMLAPLTNPRKIPFNVRIQALGAMAALGSEGAIRDLRKQLFANAGDVRAEALVQLGAVADMPEAQAALASMLTDDFPAARMVAAAALARSKGRRKYRTRLARVYEYAWFFSQGQGGDWRSSKYFDTLGPEDVIRMQVPAIRAVGAIGAPPTSGLLYRLMVADSPDVRLNAAAAAVEFLQLSHAERTRMTLPPRTR